eukprot:scaffold1355_cov268-Pinguiococcus_pyrenoidosus.AAC.82
MVSAASAQDARRTCTWIAGGRTAPSYSRQVDPGVCPGVQWIVKRCAASPGSVQGPSASSFCSALLVSGMTSSLVRETPNDQIASQVAGPVGKCFVQRKATCAVLFGHLGIALSRAWPLGRYLGA